MNYRLTVAGPLVHPARSGVPNNLSEFRFCHLDSFSPAGRTLLVCRDSDSPTANVHAARTEDPSHRRLRSGHSSYSRRRRLDLVRRRGLCPSAKRRSRHFLSLRGISCLANLPGGPVFRQLGLATGPRPAAAWAKTDHIPIQANIAVGVICVSGRHLPYGCATCVHKCPRPLLAGATTSPSGDE